MDNYSLIIDIDGTLCPIKKPTENYADLQPFQEIVDKIRALHEQGVKIVLFSSRNMNSYNGNLGIINIKTAPILLEWLKKWNIPFDEIYFGKPWPGHKGFYVDDRSVRPKEFLNNTFEQLEELCEKDRLKCK